MTAFMASTMPNSHMNCCRICEERLKVGENAFPLDSTKTMASNSTMASKVGEILELEQNLSGLVCQVCHDIVDQIDFFVQNFVSMKELLRQRYSKTENVIKTTVPGKLSSNVTKRGGNRSSLIDNMDDEEEEEEDEEDEDDEECNELMGDFSHRRRANIEGGVILDESETLPGSYRRITSLEYDMFKLRLPPDSMPKIERSPFPEVTCVHCQDLFDCWTDKVAHYLSKHIMHPEKEAFQCPTDGTLLKPEELREHATSFHGYTSNRFGNFWNEMAFVRTEDLQPGDAEGRRQIEGEDRHQCTCCGLICNGLMSFYYHRHCHHHRGSSFPPTCPFCKDSSQVLSVEGLKRHILRGHIAIKDERKQFPVAVATRTVVAEPAANSEEPMSCENCGLSFTRRCNYNQHTRKCLTGFACRHCERSFEKGDKALAHFRQFQKDHVRRCKLKFGKKGNGSGATKACKSCGKKFPSYHLLRKHRESCESTSCCSGCGETFSCKRRLAAHVKNCNRGEELEQQEESESDPDDLDSPMSGSTPDEDSEDVKEDISGDEFMEELLNPKQESTIAKTA